MIYTIKFQYGTDIKKENIPIGTSSLSKKLWFKI